MTRSVLRFVCIAGMAEICALAATPEELFRSLEARIRDAQAQAIPLLAPASFAELQRQYEQAERLRRAGRREPLRGAVEAAERSLDQAVRKSDGTRKSLANVLAARDAILKLDPSFTAKTAEADRLLHDAAARYEGGNASQGEALARSAELEYNRAGAAFLRESRLPEARAALDAARGKVLDATFQKVNSELDLLNTLLDGSREVDLASAASRIGDIIGLLYPPFFRNPPMTLTIGAFTLYVERYDKLSWDFDNGVITGASGTAWTSFSCTPKFIPYPGILTITKDFRVVETVHNPLEEISAQDAQSIDPLQGINSTLPVAIPAYAVSPAQVSQAIRDRIKFRPKGDIRVHFDNLTIKPSGTPGVGIVQAGSAAYPTLPPLPDKITLPVAGFTVYLSALRLTPAVATATGELEFPTSIVEPGSGHPGRVTLGDFSISSQCEFHKELPAAAFGIWSIGNTEVLIQGTGVIADFDKSWAAPGLDPSSDAAASSWRGAILNSGFTIPAADIVTSNSAYLRAAYTFSKAEVTAPGLKGHFLLGAPFEFVAIEPFDYKVHLGTGSLDLKESAVARASFQMNTITAPLAAVQTETGAAVQANCPNLDVDSNLDLLANVKVSSHIRWGEYTKHAARPIFYEAAGFTRERFYLSGTYKVNYFPIDTSGDFVDPNAIAADLRPLGMQGLSVFLPEELLILTTDTPSQKSLKFRPTNESTKANWLNISFGGVHGSLDMLTTFDSNKELGPTGAPFYVGNQPFLPAQTTSSIAPAPLDTDYRISTQFVTSAAYESDMRGAFRIPMPVGSDLEFTNLSFTSTALISGAKAPFTTPLPLTYWGLDMVKKPGASAAAVISVRTGQVFFTAAGIREMRHFDAPFYLIWGEMLADGSLKRLVFDYSGVGQKFDRFPFTTSFLRLSDYDRNQPGLPAFLKVAGTVHFDLFGPKYINVNDVYDPASPAAPFNKRRLPDLMTDSDPGGLFQASDQHLTANWSSDFGNMDFTYHYDQVAQDGFIGQGRMGFLWVSGTMAASIVLKAERACMTVNETTHHDFTVGPVAHLGSMSRTTGCGCIENGQLTRVELNSELEPSLDVNILLRSAGYGSLEWSLTPTVSTIEVAGDMFLTILAGGNIEVSGKATFTLDRDKDFVEGEIDGKVDMGTALGAGSLTADGQLNWHLGTFGGSAYQSIQGKLAVHVVSPVAGIAAEGGFYAAINAPKSEAWVLGSGGDRYPLNMAPLPARLTGVYGYAKMSDSINLFVFSGGIEAYAGIGAFVLTPAQVASLGAQASGLGPGLPFVIGNVGMHISGEILGGLVSAGGTADLNIIAPYPFSFQGTLGLEGCVVWVACGNVDVSIGLNNAEGLFVR